ncbi:MAG TPA: urease accessory protein UreE [Microcoleaceae cyanobacterium]
MITLTQRLAENRDAIANLTLSLTAEERLRSRYTFTASDGQQVHLQLPRGTILHDGDRLYSEDGIVVRVVAKAEAVLTVTAETVLDLLQAAYHLGNRHVPLEITTTYLRLSPDPVLRQLLEHRGLQVTEEMQPFHPETGAYGHHH